MIAKKVEQKKLADVDNYNDFWENMVSRVLESIAKDGDEFVYEYNNHYKRLMTKVVNSMTVVPIDIKATLAASHHRLMESMPVDPDPNKPAYA